MRKYFIARRERGGAGGEGHRQEGPSPPPARYPGSISGMETVLR